MTHLATSPFQKPAPRPEDLQRGDLLWPRHPEVSTLPGADLEADLARWLARQLGWDLPKGLWQRDQLTWDDVRTLITADDDPTIRALLGAVQVWSAIGGVTLPQPSEFLAGMGAGLLGLADGQVDAFGRWLDRFRQHWAGPVLDLVLVLAAMKQVLPAGSVGSLGTPGLDSLQLPASFLNRATLGGVYVGHVGMVDWLDGQPWVIESSYVAGGVQVQPYATWLAHRQAMDAQVWHGRIHHDTARDRFQRPLTDADRQRMLEKAHTLRMLRKQYAIFDRGSDGKLTPLGEDSWVYCSELIVLAAKEAGVDLDARTGWARQLPFLGPRALAENAQVRMLNCPGGQPY